MAHASGTLLRRQACLIVLLAGGLLAGPFTPSVGAQPRDRVELQIGGGYVFPVGPTVRRGTYDVSAAFWLTDQWGVAVRRMAVPSVDVADPRFDHGRASFTSGMLGLRPSTVTVHRRWFTERGVEFDVGFGVMHGVNRYAYFLSEDPPLVQDESILELALELLVGRKVSRYVGFKGGVMLDLGNLDNGNMHLVGLAVIGF